jgi:hypothetical protein
VPAQFSFPQANSQTYDWVYDDSDKSRNVHDCVYFLDGPYLVQDVQGVLKSQANLRREFFGRHWRYIIILLIESGMALFSVQLARLVVNILPTTNP